MRIIRDVAGVDFVVDFDVILDREMHAKSHKSFRGHDLDVSESWDISMPDLISSSGSANPHWKARPVDTHPWLTFHINAQSLLPETWVRLGEASSKIDHISGVPLRPTTADELMQVYLTKGIHGTTAIEGNTLSETDVRRRLEGDLDLPPSQEYLGREVDNIVNAYNWIIEQIEKGAHLHITPEDLRRFNKMILEDLDVDEDVVPGEYRTHVVGVNDYRSPPPDRTDELMVRLCAWLNSTEWDRYVGARFAVPIIRAIAAHLYIAWVHPFGDGNGRTARLVEFDILTRAGVPPISAHLLSDHYNQTRAAYYSALSRARNDPSHFIRYAVAGLVDGLRDQLKTVREQQMSVAWINYVHMRFDELPPGTPSDRQRRIAIALSLHERPVPSRLIPSLDTKISDLYAHKTSKTVTRDLNRLQDLALIKPTKGGWVANLSAVRAFLPLVNPTALDPSEPAQKELPV